MPRDQIRNIDGYTVTTRRDGRYGLESFIETPGSRHEHPETGLTVHDGAHVLTEHLPGRGRAMRRGGMIHDATEGYASYVIRGGEHHWDFGDADSPKFDLATLTAWHEEQIQTAIQDMKAGVPEAAAAAARAAALSFPAEAAPLLAAGGKTFEIHTFDLPKREKPAELGR